MNNDDIPELEIEWVRKPSSSSDQSSVENESNQNTTDGDNSQLNWDSMDSGQIRVISRGNFDASKLNETMTLIEATFKDNACSYCSSISNAFSRISSIVSSDDSNLSQSCSNVSDLLNQIKTELESTVSEIITELGNYAAKTIENEEGTIVSIDSINSEIDSIRELLAGL